MITEVKFPQRRNTVRRLPCFSCDNEHIPVTALKNGDIFTQGDKKVLFYNFYYNSPIRTITRQADVLARLKDGMDNLGAFHIQIKYPDLPNPNGVGATPDVRYYWIDYGGIWAYPQSGEHMIPLMLLCIKRRFLFAGVDNPERNMYKFALVIDNAFPTAHHKFFRNVNSLYISLINQAGIDIVYTNDLLNRCYRTDEDDRFEFNSFDEMENYSAVINQLLEADMKETIRL